MKVVGQICLMGTVLAPLAGAGAMAALGHRRSAGARLCAMAHWLGVALAGVLVVVVAANGAIGVGLRSHGALVAGVVANHLTVTLVALVLGIGAIVQSFSIRYLRNDGRTVRFFAGAGVLVGAMVMVSASDTLAGLVIGWVVASLGFLAIVGYRRDLPGVAAATRRTAATFLVGDGALVVAAALVWVRAGNLSLDGPGVLAHGASSLGTAGPVVAVLIALAALARCAQGPFGRWLPGTVAAPTPVSALLHAGFVNGGAILLIRTGAIASTATLGVIITFAVAVATAVVATAVMVHSADVKSELAYSTMGQMGFMLAECAVGAFGAGVVHLVGHALYKATLFLGSGGQMPRPGAVVTESHRSSGPGRLFVAALAGGASLVVVLLIPGMAGHRGSGPLAVFVAATAAVGTWSFWSRMHAGRSAVAGALVVGASALYGLVATGLFAWVAPGLPPVGSAVLNPWLLLLVAVGGVTTVVLLALPGIGLRLRVALIDLGAPAAGATQPAMIRRPVPIPQRETRREETPVWSAA